MLEHKGTQVIRTGRLVLRPFVKADAAPMFRNWASDPEVTKFLTWPTHARVEISQLVVDSWVDGYREDNFYQWAITLAEAPEEPIGSISVVRIEEHIDAVEVGYCMGRQWWHQGIMSEALGGLIGFLFTQVGVNRIVAHHDPNNPHSGGVMKKCGMTYEGTFRQAGRNNRGICDICQYALLREDRK